MQKQLILLISLFIFATPGLVTCQEMNDSLDQQEMMALYMELAQPGEEHDLMEKLTGEWQVDMTFWMEPGGGPISSTGTAVNEMILGGRFLQMKGEGEVIGVPSENLNIVGFDRRFEVYTIVGFDTWGTYFITARGTYDEATESITMYGEDADPIMGITQKYDIVIKFVSDDKYITRIFFKDDFHTQGKGDFKMVETVSCRIDE